MRLQRALEEMVVEGVKTNIPLHQELLQQDDVNGNYSIKWLEEWLKTRDALGGIPLFVHSSVTDRQVRDCSVGSAPGFRRLMAANRATSARTSS